MQGDGFDDRKGHLQLCKLLKYFFRLCVAELWNLLLQDVVTAANLEGFKGELDKFMEDEATNAT